MICEFLIDFMFGMAAGVLQFLDIEFDYIVIFSGEALNLFVNFLKAACYFLPIYTLLPLFGIWFALWTWKVLVSLFRTLWDVLPFF